MRPLLGVRGTQGEQSGGNDLGVPLLVPRDEALGEPHSCGTQGGGAPAPAQAEGRPIWAG